jgi:hypothetical protein
MILAYFEVMIFARPKKVFLFFLMAGAWVLSGASSHATVPRLGGPELRSRVVWGQAVEYQLILKNNPRLPFDGEASRKQVKGRETHFILLNKAFFHKEAKSLFARFEKDASAQKQNPPSGEQLRHLEERLLSLLNSTKELPNLDQETELSLKQLESYLEYLAWSPLYQQAKQNSVSQKEAEQYFERQFTQTRLETIEWHEAAHLADIKGKSDTQGEAFSRFTELNAFFAELVYGANPHDVMAQALTGLIDELRRGQNVDFSRHKVVTLLDFFNDAPHSGGCLEMLSQLKTADFVLAGQELRRKNTLVSGQNTASLR